MQYRIRKEHVWSGPIPDHRGALAEKLQALSAGGLNFELVIARREWTGRGLLFVSPLRTVAEIEAAESAGLSQSDSLLALRIEGPDKPGLAAKIAGSVAGAGVDVRGFSAMTFNEQVVIMIAFDTALDCDRARQALNDALAD